MLSRLAGYNGNQSVRGGGGELVSSSGLVLQSSIPTPPNQPLPPLPSQQHLPTAPGTCTLPRRGLVRDTAASKVRSPSNPPATNRQGVPERLAVDNQQTMADRRKMSDRLSMNDRDSQIETQGLSSTSINFSDQQSIPPPRVQSNQYQQSNLSINQINDMQYQANSVVNSMNQINLNRADSQYFQNGIPNIRPNFQTNGQFQMPNNTMPYPLSNTQPHSLNDIHNSPFMMTQQMNNMVNALNGLSYSTNALQPSQTNSQLALNNIRQQQMNQQRIGYLQSQINLHNNNPQFMLGMHQGSTSMQNGSDFQHHHQELNHQQNMIGNKFNDLQPSAHNIQFPNKDQFDQNEHCVRHLSYQDQEIVGNNRAVETTALNNSSTENFIQGHRARSYTLQNRPFVSCNENVQDDVLENGQPKWNQRDQDSGFDSLGSRFGDSGPKSLNFPQNTMDLTTLVPSKSTDNMLLASQSTKNLSNGNHCQQYSPVKVRDQYTSSPSSISQVISSDSVYPHQNEGRRYELVENSIRPNNRATMLQKPSNNMSRYQSNDNHEELKYEDLLCDDNLNPVAQKLTKNSQLTQSVNIKALNSPSRNNSFTKHNNNSQNTSCPENATPTRQSPLVSNGANQQFMKKNSVQCDDNSDLYIQEIAEHRHPLQINRSFRLIRSQNSQDDEHDHQQRVLLRDRNIQHRNSRDRFPAAGEAAPSKISHKFNDSHVNERANNILNRHSVHVSNGISSKNNFPNPSNCINFLQTVEDKLRRNSDNDERTVCKVSYSDGLTVRDRPLSYFNDTSHSKLFTQVTNSDERPNPDERPAEARPDGQAGHTVKQSTNVNNQSPRPRTSTVSDKQNEDKQDSPSVSWMEWTQQLQVLK